MNGSGIRLTSADDHIELDNNRIYNITGLSAMGITAYGTDSTGHRFQPYRQRQ